MIYVMISISAHGNGGHDLGAMGILHCKKMGHHTIGGYSSQATMQPPDIPCNIVQSGVH